MYEPVVHTVCIRGPGTVASGGLDSGRKKPRGELAQGFAKRCLSWASAPGSFGLCDSDRRDLGNEGYKHLPQEWGHLEQILLLRDVLQTPPPHPRESYPWTSGAIWWPLGAQQKGGPPGALGPSPERCTRPAGLQTCCTAGPDLSEGGRALRQKGGLGTVAKRRTDHLSKGVGSAPAQAYWAGPWTQGGQVRLWFCPPKLEICYMTNRPHLSQMLPT